MAALPKAKLPSVPFCSECRRGDGSGPGGINGAQADMAYGPPCPLFSAPKKCAFFVLFYRFVLFCFVAAFLRRLSDSVSDSADLQSQSQTHAHHHHVFFAR